MFSISGLGGYSNAVKCIEKLRVNGIASGESAGGIWVSSEDLRDKSKELLVCEIATEFGGRLHLGDTPLMAYQKQQMADRETRKLATTEAK